MLEEREIRRLALPNRASCGSSFFGEITVAVVAVACRLGVERAYTRQVRGERVGWVFAWLGQEFLRHRRVVIAENEPVQPDVFVLRLADKRFSVAA